MPYVKTIVCLANSYKSKGRCIAGREVISRNRYGGWIRPVSARPKEEVALAECRYTNNALPKVLEIINVPLLHVVPNNHQTENHLLDPKRRWTKIRDAAWDDLEDLRERPPSLWINRDSTAAGHFDCMTPAQASRFRQSLILLWKDEFIVEVGSRMWDGVKSKTYRGKFSYNGTDYNLSVTDPAVREVVQRKSEGQYLIENVYLCISLTEPFEDGRCHKLVAAVIHHNRWVRQ